jgi:hypothetical protein
LKTKLRWLQALTRAWQWRQAKAFAESGASVALADWNEKAVRSATRNWLLAKDGADFG